MRAGFVIETHSPQETAALGRCAGRQASPGQVFCLRGELGTGKTVFISGLASGLLGREIPVTSPSYVLEHVHRGKAATLYHIDLYRLAAGAGDFDGAGLRECLTDPQGVACIEWADRLAGLLPDDRIDVEIEHVSPQRRAVHVLATGPRSGQVVDRVVRSAGTRERLLASMLAQPDRASAGEAS